MSTLVARRGNKQQAARSDTPDFNRLAHTYRWMEWLSFGPFLWRCRCHFLPQLHSHRRALVLGDGDGRFTARLLAENSEITLDAVDVSSAMVRELIRRARPNSERLHTQTADAREFEPSRRDYDLVITHFFLDCLTTAEVRSLACRLRRSAEADATWVISEFEVPAGWFGRFLAAPLIAFLYQAFGWLTGLKVRQLPDHGSALSSSGWALAEKRTWLGGLLVSARWRAD